MGMLRSGAPYSRYCCFSLLPDSPESSNVTAWPEIPLMGCARLITVPGGGGGDPDGEQPSHT